MKGTQWVIKTPRLKCRCGCTLHMENRGKWRIIYDSEGDGRSRQAISLDSCAADQNLVRVGTAAESPKSHRATPTSTLSTPYDTEQEPPPRAEDDSEG